MMNGRFNRLVCAAGIMLCGFFALPVTAADVYKPVNLQTVSRDLQNFKITSRYHLEKAMTQSTNPFGTMPKNKALTVVTGKDTLANLARNAKKGTALAVAVTGAVAAAGWVIDELTGQIVRSVEVEIIPVGAQSGYGWKYGSGPVFETPVEAVQDWIDTYSPNRTISSASCYNSSSPCTTYRVITANPSGTFVVPRVTCPECNLEPHTENQWLPVSNDELLPKLAPIPTHVWDSGLKDEAGRPRMTDELRDALRNWYNDLADRDPYLTFDPNTWRFIYAPPPPPDQPDIIIDPIDIDVAPQPPTNPDEWDTAQPGSEWPGFCDWATVVCDWLEWTKEEPENMEPDQLPVDELTVADLKKEYSSGLGIGSCPAPVSFTFQGQTGQFSYENACWAATNLFKPVLLMMAGIMAAFIIVGASRRAV